MKIRTLIPALAVLALAGCGSAPVSTTAALTGNCTMPPAPLPWDASTSSGPTLPLEYTMTLTNTSAVDGNVSQIVTAFSDASGSEMTSDQQGASGVILPGQSLTWSFPLPDQLISAPVQVGTVSQRQADAPGSQMYAGDELDSESILAATCQLAEWG
jgi:hypothetical protein